MLQEIIETKLENASKKADAILFDATQNVRIVANAEHYYHSMIQANEQSWNIRDHQVEFPSFVPHNFPMVYQPRSG